MPNPTLTSLRSLLLSAMGLGLAACSSGAAGSTRTNTGPNTTGGSDAGGFVEWSCANPVGGIGPDTSSTGLVQCEDGTVARDAPATCSFLGPRADFEIGVDLVPDSEMVACRRDADCADAALGYCDMLDGQMLGTECRYGCTTDADCNAGQICECGELAGHCVPSNCRSRADCGPGQLCAANVDPGACSDGFGGPGGYLCTTPNDECRANADCGSEGAVRCAPDDMGVRRCSEQTLCGIGRPFLVEDAPRLASAERRGDWLPTLRVDHASLGLEARRLLAEHYTRVALMEHASVAAFARFAMQLLQLGAPADLIAFATEAMRDEIRHAKLCFGVASAYGARDVGPGALDVSGALDATSLADIVRDVLLEGCVGETVAAHEASEAARSASAPAVRHMLQGIARDEAEHAALAWRFVRWALEQDPRLAPTVTALARDCERELAAESLRADERSDGALRASLVAHGCLPLEARARVRRDVLRQVVIPCALALVTEVERAVHAA